MIAVPLPSRFTAADQARIMRVATRSRDDAQPVEAECARLLEMGFPPSHVGIYESLGGLPIAVPVLLLSEGALEC